MANDIFHNHAFVSWFIASLLAQGSKILQGLVRERRFDFRWVSATGGMPSTHAAGVSALSTTLGVEQGWNSPLFATAAAFAIIIMFDAQGVRRSVGRQAQVLNKMITDISHQRGLQHERVFELLGHTPMQVFAGAALGAAVALLLYGV